MKTIVGTESWDATKERWLSLARKIDRGERITPVRRIMFEHSDDT